MELFHIHRRFSYNYSFSRNFVFCVRSVQQNVWLVEKLADIGGRVALGLDEDTGIKNGGAPNKRASTSEYYGNLCIFSTCILRKIDTSVKNGSLYLIKLRYVKYSIAIVAKAKTYMGDNIRV